MNQIKEFLDDLGVGPAPKPAAYTTSIAADGQPIAAQGTHRSWKRVRLLRGKVAGESKAERRLRRRELAR